MDLLDLRSFERAITCYFIQHWVAFHHLVVPVNS